MNIVLANPPAYLFDNSKHFIQAGSRWSHTHDIPKNSGLKHGHPYPFLLGYTAALLKRETIHNVFLVDGCAMDMDENEFIREIVSLEPNILLADIPTISFDLTMPLLSIIKGQTGCILVVTGFHVSAFPWIKEVYPFIDYIITGEYEYPFLGYVTNSNHPTWDLDDLPFPDRDEVPISRYSNQNMSEGNCIYMWASRGCPMNCEFCLERQVLYGCNSYRMRNPKRVVDEMQHLVDRYGAEQINFDDMSFTINHGFVREICEEIMSRGLNISWWCMGDMNLDYNTLRIMKRAGCIKIAFGVETIDPVLLRSSKKVFVQPRKANLLKKNCDELSILTHATYMVGLPNDTLEKAEATADFALNLDTDSAQWSIATPYPGTPFFERALKNNWLTTLEWEQYDGNQTSVVSYPDFTKGDIEHQFKKVIKIWGVHRQGFVNYHSRKMLGKIYKRVVAR